LDLHYKIDVPVNRFRICDFLYRLTTVTFAVGRTHRLVTIFGITLQTMTATDRRNTVA